MSVTAARGFSAAGTAAGIKKSGDRDVALVVNEGPSRSAAGVFTTNRVRAAPVVWCEQALNDGELSAVVVNSGGANACTGPEGFEDTRATAARAAAVLPGHDISDIAVLSTGLIGVRLPMEKLLAGIDEAAATRSPNGGEPAAIAIKTTDSVHKTAVVSQDGWTVGGMAKGAGMLAPGLATMLVVLTTDAVLDSASLDSALRSATRATFDLVDSDGCMSTNDTVLLLSSGASGLSPAYPAFAGAVRAVCADLALQIVADAEGASKEIRIDVTNAASEDDAIEVGRSIARNNLLKCAIHGEDPNWGRVLAAIGTTSAAFDPDRIDVAINGVWVCRGGALGEDRGKVDMTGREVVITVNLGAGTTAVTVWTNDLTAEYVHENSAYSS
ncbi:bifunctional glutamate N-acetyltransferase/amino-acid acetyltransferase ArgJ [Streptomyces sp. QL37]|uniref:bifunctional glutamate N-acetyltransferase/amino-acid acetyltransferase ArgJ n=1 Tax=Streptomyces sp. QL37 TaxID=2093747 RepID=UPI000CF23CFB|nr:bifunctional glutamate N-acetyltransferase/amino-acid acetyltransferase ArgJ [Streptomyces sp. QL37]PPQ60222.1 bifunctional ornithine acetyltransferase/N-acetylglutamate synthase [Streptomyces sp. QL37]